MMLCGEVDFIFFSFLSFLNLLSLPRNNDVKWGGCGSEGNGALACGKSLD